MTTPNSSRLSRPSSMRGTLHPILAIAAVLAVAAATLIPFHPARAEAVTVWPELSVWIDPGYQDVDGFHTISAEPTLYIDGLLPEPSPEDDVDYPEYSVDLELRDAASTSTLLLADSPPIQTAETTWFSATWTAPEDLLATNGVYEFRLRAAAGGETGDWSGWYTLTVITVPAAPVLLSPADDQWVTAGSPVSAALPSGALATDTTMVFEFERGWEHGSPTSRTVYKPVGEDGTAFASVPTGYPWASGGPIRWRAMWIGHIGSEWSGYAALTAGTAPAAPTVGASGTPILLQVSWYEQSNPYISGSEFDVSISTAEGPIRETTVQGANQAQFVGVPPGDYTVSVVSRNPLGSSPAGTFPLTVDPSAWSEPENLSVHMKTLAADVSWDPPALDGGTPIIRYDVTAHGTTAPDVVVSTQDSEAELTGLVAGEEYRFTVDAVTTAGTSRAYSGYHIAFDISDAPEGVTTVIGDGFIDVFWDQPLGDNGSAVTSYVVSLSPGALQMNVPMRWGRQGARFYDLTNGDTYSAAVHAVNEAGAGPESAVVTATPLDDSTDQDADGLPDVVEVRVGSNVSLADSDADGLSDAQEVLMLAGFASPAMADTDDDGITDDQSDADGDGLSNLDEINASLDPANPDTDADGIGDGDESSAGTAPATADTDGDGLTDGQETALGLDPLEADSDSDGIIDRDDPIEREISATLSDQTGSDIAEPTPDTAPEKLIAPAVAVVSAKPAASASVSVREARGPPVIAAVSAAVRVVGTLDAGVAVAELRMGYSSLIIPDRLTNLAPVAWNHDTGSWEFVDNDVSVSTATRTITLNAPELGVLYAVVDLNAWAAYAGECGQQAVGTALHDVDVIVDSTGSVASADPTGVRFDALRAVLFQLPAASEVSVRSFGVVGVMAGRTSSPTAGSWSPNFWMSDSDLTIPTDPDLDTSGASSPEIALQWVQDLEAYGATNDDIDADFGAYEAEQMFGPHYDADEEPNGSCRTSSIVLVTDGAWRPLADRAQLGEYEELDEDYVLFRDRDVPVHVLDVGAGNPEDSQWMVQLAEDTGGTYSYVPTATDLAAWIDEVVPTTLPVPADPSLDSDEDGLPDWVEQQGIRSLMQHPGDHDSQRGISTDPLDADTDDDGLDDGEEAGESLNASAAGIPWTVGLPVLAYGMLSNPTVADSDLDGLSDPDELETGQNALSPDNDFDGLSDGDEEQFGTYSTLVDTDFDGFTDGYEALHLADGYDPAEATTIDSPIVWLNDFALGMFCGDIEFCQVDSIPWLAGNIASGVLVFGDVREAISGAMNGNWPAAGLAVFGLIPSFGDFGSASIKVAKAIERTVDAGFSRSSLRLLHEVADPTTYLQVIRQLDEGLITKIKAHAPDMSDKALAKLIDDNGIVQMQRVFNLPPSKLVQASYAAMPRPPTRLSWIEAEHYLQHYVGVPGYKQSRTSFIMGVTTKSRYYDAKRTVNNVIEAFEAKSGNACSGRAMNQASKDVAALESLEVASIQWHFFVSPWTGKIGPCQAVLSILLSDPRISLVFHLPGAP